MSTRTPKTLLILQALATLPPDAAEDSRRVLEKVHAADEPGRRVVYLQRSNHCYFAAPGAGGNGVEVSLYARGLVRAVKRTGLTEAPAAGRRRLYVITEAGRELLRRAAQYRLGKADVNWRGWRPAAVGYGQFVANERQRAVGVHRVTAADLEFLS